jgi:hypothetical protein
MHRYGNTDDIRASDLTGIKGVYRKIEAFDFRSSFGKKVRSRTGQGQWLMTQLIAGDQQHSHGFSVKSFFVSLRLRGICLALTTKTRRLQVSRPDTQLLFY